MEEGGGVGEVCVGRRGEAGGQFRRRHEPEVATLKHKPHDEVGGVVEDRADRADEDDELGDLAYAPGPGLGDLLEADVVSGNGHLGEIVEQVVAKHLNRGHREEWQPGAGANDAEHIAEVRAGAWRRWRRWAVWAWWRRRRRFGRC